MSNLDSEEFLLKTTAFVTNFNDYLEYYRILEAKFMRNQKIDETELINYNVHVSAELEMFISYVKSAKVPENQKTKAIYLLEEFEVVINKVQADIFNYYKKQNPIVMN